MGRESVALLLASMMLGALLGLILGLALAPPKTKYIYDDEARLVGYCQGKYLIREEEDEFPSGCYFIEPISWEG